MANNQKQKSKFPLWLFAIVFIIGALLPFINKMFSPARATLAIRNNAGSGALLSCGSTLVAVFANGKAAAWDWSNPAQPLWQHDAGSDRVVMLDDSRMAGVTKTGRKLFFIDDVKQDKRLSSFPIGWEDQDLWLVQSPDKKRLAAARINPDKDGRTLYEFMTINSEKGDSGLPVSVDVASKEKRFRFYAVSCDGKIAAVGSKDNHGLLIIVDPGEGKVILDKEYDQAQEFTGIAFTPDGSLVFLTNKNGSVYGIQTADGAVKYTFTVLKPGQKNPVTNETTSKNVTVSADGRCVAAEVINVANVWDIQTGQHLFKIRPSHKLTGPMALSPDSLLLATSDIRASGTIQFWQIKK